MQIVSWNVNGVRAIKKKSFLEWLQETQPDIVCLQETKAQKHQLPQDLLEPVGYKTFWHSAEKKGYSSVATFCKKNPISVQYGIGIKKYDKEGRVLITEHPKFILFNIYFPNGMKNEERLNYKLDFYKDALKLFNKLKKDGKKVIVCGDFNTAHKEIDLARPKENANNSGFLPIERELLDKLESYGFIDSFRHFNKEPHQYSWWDYQTKARERNVGWRIDYHFISDNLLSSLKNASIWQNVIGSDHCPVTLEI